MESYQKDIINKNKNHQSPKNKLGMEGRIPTMPGMYIRNFTLLRTSRVGQAKTSWAQYISPRPVVCPQCGCKALKLYDHYSRKAAFINDEGARRVLIIKARRVKCLHCSYLFREPIEGLLPKKRSSEQYRLVVAQEYIKSVNNKTIAREFAISPSTVERIIHERFHLKIREALNYPAPLMIGMDEHAIHQGGRFATTIVDLSNHRVYDVVEGKSSNLVERRLMTYKDRQKVTTVVMDLSSNYTTIVRKCFPNANIVAERFHVIRMMSHHFMEFCRQAQESIRWKRPLIRALRKRACNLTARERQTRQELFELNPAIGVCHEFKEKLGDCRD